MISDHTLMGLNTGITRSRDTSSSHGYSLTIVYHPTLSLVGATIAIPDTTRAAFPVSRLEPVFRQAGSMTGNTLSDPYVSRKPVLIESQPDGVWITADLQGSQVFVEKEKLAGRHKLDLVALKRGVMLNLSGRILLMLHTCNQVAEHVDDLEMLGISDDILLCKKAIRQVADLAISVLIRGETGTGKELVARSIHQLSRRASARLLAVNVGAIPQSLAIAELFGTKKGAFTGAVKDKPGYFQLADGGTLFLDEIGDASDEVQVALLRTLETGLVQPIGAADAVRVDVRLIAATDADIEKKTSDNSFRNPLLQRLAGYEIWLPPLRNRRVDIGLLLARFLRDENEKHQAGVLLDADNEVTVAFWRKVFQSALEYHWPGNIRQLRNVAQQLVVHNRGQQQLTVPFHLQHLLLNRPAVTVDDGHDYQVLIAAPDEPDESEENEAAHGRRKPSEVSHGELLETLRTQRYDLKNTATALNISRAALYKMIDRDPAIRKAGDLRVEEISATFKQCHGDLERMVDILQVSKAALKRRVNELNLL